MKELLEKYGFDFNAENCVILENCSVKEIGKAWGKMRSYITKKKQEKKRVMIFFLFAGHGMIHMNEQVLLCNQLSKGFY